MALPSTILPPAPSGKAGTLFLVEQEHARMAAALAGLSGEQLTTPGLAAAWGVRELAIHLEGWFRVGLDSIPIFLRGERREESYSDYDAWNARFVEEGAGLSGDDAVARMEATYEELRAYLQALPEDAFERHAIVDTIEGSAWGHFGEHYYDTWRFRAERGWLPEAPALAGMPETRIEGLRALWVEYDRLYGALLRLTDEQLAAPMPGDDWSPRDVVAHITAWQRANVNEIPKLLAGVPVSPETAMIEDFNARAVERARGLSLHALMAEYHAANNHFFAYANTLIDGAFAKGSPARSWLLLPHPVEHYGGVLRLQT